jgi:hypothetical protein
MTRAEDNQEDHGRGWIQQSNKKGVLTSRGEERDRNGNIFLIFKK